MLQFQRELFGIAAGVTSVFAAAPYICSILNGRTRPSGPSWWTWALSTTIAVSSSWFAGAGWAVLVLPICLCVSQIAVAALSVEYGDNSWDTLNKACIAGACSGIFFWLVLRQPLAALAAAIAADLLASVPNLRHAWRKPAEENRLAWTLAWCSAVLAVAAANQWSVAECGWAIYFLANATVVVVLVWRPALPHLFAGAR